MIGPETKNNPEKMARYIEFIDWAVENGFRISVTGTKLPYEDIEYIFVEDTDILSFYWHTFSVWDEFTILPTPENKSIYSKGQGYYFTYNDLCDDNKLDEIKKLLLKIKTKYYKVKKVCKVQQMLEKVNSDFAE